MTNLLKLDEHELTIKTDTDRLHRLLRHVAARIATTLIDAVGRAGSIRR
jgi:hypothetical protein